VNALGQVMNRDEDLLFLVLSSHGTRNAMIEVSNTDMPARGLAADDLAELLRQSGIRWQVVIVSACFSGAFVKPLAHEASIVITASSKHRSSFGCSDERDLTYFGEAFFRDALPAAPTLRAAAETARHAIRSRERAENVTPSRPQAHFGSSIESRLSRWGSDIGSGR
jgi:Peptidase C13 family